MGIVRGWIGFALHIDALMLIPHVHALALCGHEGRRKEAAPAA
jgi:hypothetical protein